MNKTIKEYVKSYLNDDYFPAAYRDKLDLDAALRIQLLVLQHRVSAGSTQAGWKIGLTSERVRAALKTDATPFGFLLAERVLQSPAEINTSDIAGCAIEPEICLKISKPLRGAVTYEEASNAIACVHAAFEVNERRGRGDFPMIVADNLAQWGLVIGARATSFGNLAQIQVELFKSGKQIEAIDGADALDDPIKSLQSLARVLEPYDLQVEPGQVVITGAYCRPVVSPGETYRATFSGIGSVEAHIV